MNMLVRWLVSLGVGVVTTVLTLVLCIFLNLCLGTHRNDGTDGMYGFVYGLFIGPLVGIAVAVVIWLWMRRRTMRA